ncbi:3418_t:CDS:1, partial [Cetraspora pellucida]
YLTDSITEKKSLVKRKNKPKAQLKEKIVNTKNILIKILDKLEKLEKARRIVIEGLANYF